MIIFGYVINFYVYLAIAELITAIYFIYFLYYDFKDEDLISIRTLIRDICEAFILGFSWIISIPITAIGNILIETICIYHEIKNGREED